MTCVLVRFAGVAVLGLVANSGVADAGPEWRDGCPAGNDPAYKSTNPRWTGAAPQIDSALVPSRLLVSAVSSYFTANTVVPRARLITGIAQVHGAFKGMALTASLPYSHQMSGDSDDAPRQHGNLTLGFALTHHWLSSFFGSESGTKERLAGIRSAVAFQVIASGAAEHGLDATKLGARFPFENYMFTGSPAIGGAVEYRTEAVGCYAPFFHARAMVVASFDEHFASPTMPDPNDTKLSTVLAVPVTAAVGIYATDRTALMFQYGIVVHYSADKDAEQQLFGANTVHRFRFAVEHTHDLWGQTVHVGGNFDLFSGSATLEGTVLGVYAAYNLGNP